MDLSIITVTWNSEKHIKNQMESVQKGAEGLRYEQIIVDNNSNDSTVAVVRDVGNVRMIENNTNLGFAKANNLAVKIARGQFILFLNPDMELSHSGMLKRAVEYLKENQDISIMGCKLLGRDGKQNINAGPRRFPLKTDFLIMLLKVHHFFPKLLQKYYYGDLDFDKRQTVETVRGSFMLTRREIMQKLNLTPFDERYFLWMEDVDFCRQVKRLGYSIVYEPSFACLDLVGQSFKRRNLFKKQIMFYRSVYHYIQKWG